MKIVKLPLSLAALAVATVSLLAAGAAAVRAADPKAADAPPATAARPALSVSVVQPQLAPMPVRITANGNVAAWQEASIGAEAQGFRLAEVRANVGDVVRKGQVLAVFDSAVAQADLAQLAASVAEAEATLAEATANARRARDLQPSGALSEQQIAQYLTAERTAQARLEAQRAAARVQQIRLQQTQVLAPDHGVLSSRTATVGAVVPAGQELFRLIRQGRLEWRAEVASADLVRLKPGLAARITLPGGETVAGRVRSVAPTVDAATRNGLVYVDLPAPGVAKAGMFARGEFELGSAAALTVPQTAVLLREGFAYVFTVGADSKVTQLKVGTGRREGDRVEVTGGLARDARVVAAGVGFLADGDLVRVVPAPAAAK